MTVLHGLFLCALVTVVGGLTWLAWLVDHE